MSLNQYIPCDGPRQSGGSTQIPSLKTFSSVFPEHDRLHDITIKELFMFDFLPNPAAHARRHGVPYEFQCGPGRHLWSGALHD